MSGPGTSKYKFNPCPNCCKKRIGNVLWLSFGSAKSTITNLPTLPDFDIIDAGDFVNYYSPPVSVNIGCKRAGVNEIYEMFYNAGSYTLSRRDLTSNAVVATRNDLLSGYSQGHLDFNETTNQLELAWFGNTNTPPGGDTITPSVLWKLDPSTLATVSTSNDILSALDSIVKLTVVWPTFSWGVGASGTYDLEVWDNANNILIASIPNQNYVYAPFGLNTINYSKTLLSTRMFDWCTNNFDNFSSGRMSMTHYDLSNFQQLKLTVKVTPIVGTITWSPFTNSTIADSGPYSFGQGNPNPGQPNSIVDVGPNQRSTIFNATDRRVAGVPTPSIYGRTNSRCMAVGWVVNSIGHRFTLVKVLEQNLRTGLGSPGGGAKVWIAEFDENMSLVGMSPFTYNGDSYSIQDLTIANAGFSMLGAIGYTGFLSWDTNVNTKTIAQQNYTVFAVSTDSFGAVQRRFQNSGVIANIIGRVL